MVRPVLVAVFCLFPLGPASAQQLVTGPTAVTVGALAGVSTQAVFRFPVGYGARLRVGPVEFGYERLHASGCDIGSTCSGLVFPGEDCGPEDLDVEGDHRAGYAAIAISWVLGRSQLHVAPEVGIARFEGVQHGLRTGRSLGDESTFFSLGVGGRAVSRPFGSVPLGLTAGVLWRTQFEVAPDSCVDCFRGYSGVGVLLGSLGVSHAFR